MKCHEASREEQQHLKADWKKTKVRTLVSSQQAALLASKKIMLDEICALLVVHVLGCSDTSTQESQENIVFAFLGVEKCCLTAALQTLARNLDCVVKLCVEKTLTKTKTTRKETLSSVIPRGWGVKDLCAFMRETKQRSISKTNNYENKP